MSDHHRPPRVYQEALGIHVGDLVSTSYHTGPYEVWSITPASYIERGLETVIRLWPVVALACVPAGGKPNYAAQDTPYSWISGVRQAVMADGASRWFTDQNDEVIVRMPEKPPALPIDMFASYPPLPEPPAWRPGVDYTNRGDGVMRLWRCATCGLDFNGTPISRYAHVAICPDCGQMWGHPLYLMPREAGTSTYMLALNKGAYLPYAVRRPRLDERAVGEIDLPVFVPCHEEVSA